MRSEDEDRAGVGLPSLLPKDTLGALMPMTGSVLVKLEFPPPDLSIFWVELALKRNPSFCCEKTKLAAAAGLLLRLI